MDDLDAFVAHIRHELRAPINAILGYSQLLMEEADGLSIDAAEHGDLERVADSGTQVLRIISDVLDPAGLAGNIPAAAVRLQHAVQAPLTTIHDCLESLLGQHAHDAAGDDLRRIQLAAVRLAEVVAGLAHALAVRVATDCEMPPPLSVDAALEVKTPDSADMVSGGSILVIDDEEANRMLLCRRLIRDGYSVLVADTGEAGLALAARESVDVILLDVMMPGISGYEVLARLKADGALREIPVLMITAVDGAESVTRCIALGADDVINHAAVPDWGAKAAELAGGGVDHVVEVGGPGTLAQSMQAVGFGGEIALIGVLSMQGDTNPMPLMLKGASLRGIFVGSAQMARDLNAFVDRHAVKPVIDRCFDFADAPAAYAYQASSALFGKVVIGDGEG